MIFKIAKKMFFIVLAIFYISFVSTFFALYLVNPMAAKGSDLASFIAGAEMIKTGNAGKIYDENTQLLFQQKIVNPNERSWLLPFRSPPVIAALFIQLSYLKFSSAYTFFLLVNIIALFLFSLIISKIFPKIGKLYLVFLLALTYWPVISVLEMGQYTLFLALTFLLIYKYAKGKNIFLAGLISGILLIKPQYFLFIPFIFFLISEKKQFVKGLLISSVFIILANIAVSGPGQLIKYPSFLIGTEAANYGSRSFQMFTLYGLFKNVPLLKDFPNWSLLSLNFLLYAAALFIFAKKAMKYSLNRGFVVGIIFTILFSVHALVHDLSLLLVPIFILLNLTVLVNDGQIKFYKIAAGVLFFLPLIIFTTNTMLAVPILLLMGLFFLISPNLLNSDY